MAEVATHGTLPLTEKLATISYLNAHDCEWFLKKALELYEEFGTRISGCMIMIRVDDGTDNCPVYRHENWRNAAELLGHLQAHTQGLIDEYFNTDE